MMDKRTTWTKRQRRLLIVMLAIVATGLWVSGCAHSEPSSAREVSQIAGGSVTQAELQQDLERFSGLFIARVAKARESIEAEAPPEEQTQALRLVLLYYTSVLDIATGRRPEVNLLDMLAFIMLARASLAEHWIPEVFEKTGQPLLAAIDASATELWEIADKVMRPEQQRRLRDVVRAWQQDHPDLRRVEAVRLFSFSGVAGKLATEQARQARGLLSSVTAATRAADEAILLANRALFLAQRMPFLLRMQTRLGAREVMADGMTSLTRAEALLARVPELQPTLHDASLLAGRTLEATREARDLVEALRPLLESPAEGQEELPVAQLIASGNRLVEDARTLVHELDNLQRVLLSADRLASRSEKLLEGAQALLRQDEGEPLATASTYLDRLVRRWLGYAALVGAFLIVLFWGGYVAARRFTASAAPARSDKRHPPASGQRSLGAPHTERGS